MGMRKGYNTDRCPDCHSRLVVKHSRKNGKYHYCTCCGNIVFGRRNEAITERDSSDYDTEPLVSFNRLKGELEMIW